MPNTASSARQWVEEVARLTRPDRVHWCDGSREEYDALVAQLVRDGGLIPINDGQFEDCYLHRSDPSDVARVENLTFICTADREDAGPNNKWMAPNEAHRMLDGLFEDCMQGRTMYVIPYCMGPINSPYARCGIEVTDSAYVAVNMYLMTRMGAQALDRIEREGKFVKGMHSIGELDPERRYIMHFPEELSIRSYGSGYGGNALLGKKCHALRIASWQARQEGWLAEHMLIVEIENPAGEKHYVAAAFPSACGKTNLAMLIPPKQFPGWQVRTVGDDIAWLHLDDDGVMRAINPEAGYFGVVPGTNRDTNNNAFEMLQRDAIFTNVGLSSEKEPWWEGRKFGVPVLNWKGEPIKSGEKAAHPNSRFTVSAQCNPSYSPMAEHAAGVPLSALIFGGRRARLAPLVMEARDWRHGVLMGAAMASESTAASSDSDNGLRRDPMAMKPFCGYNFADYWKHWLSFSGRSDRLPGIYHVNWFRQNEAGEYLWPGFGENLRVLQWILERRKGRADARATPVGNLPRREDLNLQGLDIAPEAMDDLLDVDTAGWREEMRKIAEYLAQYGDRVPAELSAERARVAAALG
ncbi:MAG: phosphoenolpyruvate carboxykinase (GTP) [Gammaproteobacteria bacterium]|nr:phosphoenolpyruvate carboxykinase (GTP) [Gammaproteobacteria bacterium]MYF58420.1 phosphoenolpyruvate carboxykinase (GTP) [Gammaproteobacteria bacterium]